MTTFEECPNCGNKEDGDSIWECENCGLVHCMECDMENGYCPRCRRNDLRKIGYIDADCYRDCGFSRCPHCGNSKVGDSIWKCEDCGLIHCMNCDDPDNGHCPECNGIAERVGEIE